MSYTIPSEFFYYLKSSFTLRHYTELAPAIGQIGEILKGSILEVPKVSHFNCNIRFPLIISSSFIKTSISIQIMPVEFCIGKLTVYYSHSDLALNGGCLSTAFILHPSVTLTDSIRWDVRWERTGHLAGAEAKENIFGGQAL